MRRKISNNTIFSIIKTGSLPVLILFLCSAATQSRELQLKIDEGWVIKTGDNAAWAKPPFDNNGWKPISVGKPWEMEGYDKYDGYAWYRVKFVIPKKWKENAEVKESENNFLILSMGPVDDVDVTYFNGEKIGSTGRFPPRYATAYDELRKYKIPMQKINWGESNFIAVRIYDGENTGGIYEGPVVIKMPGIEDVIDLSYKLSDADGIYHFPHSISFKLKVTNNSSAKYCMKLVSTLKSDHIKNAILIDSHKKTMHIDPHTEVYESIRFNPPAPGFYRVTCMLGDGGETAEKSMVFGYDPQKIKTALTREPDFENFWKKRKQELAKVDPQFKVTRDKRSNEDLGVYLVEMRSLGNVRIRGWFTVPTKTGPHPAIISVPGYTVTMRPYSNRKNVATFALNPRGHGNSKDDVDPKGDEHMFLGFDMEHPERYIYVGTYMDCVRACDFLASRPEIDKTRIGVEGGSQGGGLSYATAAHDDMIIFCEPDIPWLGDWIGYIEASPWPGEHYPELIKRFPGLAHSDINRLLSYIDTMNLADRINCPVLMSVGLQDNICPPRNAFATYNRVNAKKEFYVYPFARHDTNRWHSKIKDKWMGEMLAIEKSGL